ncbi:MAG: protein-L-isoaspartate O-methyltransferase family protein [Betaproteobacteria bacterium]|jgi:protein-L-isoaspartate(D-aspartate) O-methyltransferase
MTAIPPLDLERARFNMVEQQIRPWQVLDPAVLDLLAVVRREDYVPPAYRALAFTDMEIPLRVDGVDSGQSMWAPKMEARILQDVSVKPQERVLEIGTGSGYLAALFAHKAREVLSVEIDPRMARFGADNLARHGVRNVRVEVGDAARGRPAAAPYDVIVVTGSLPAVPEALLAQLQIGGRLAAVVGDAPAMHAQITTRMSADGFDTRRLFETEIKPLTNAWRPSRFVF